MIRSSTSIFSLMLIATLCAACGTFSLYDPDRGEKIATVGEKTLYEGELKNIYNANMTPEDSMAQRELFINQWVAKQIKNQAAEKSLSEFEKQIEQMVNNYREALVAHQFEENYVAQNIDTNVTTAQIGQYYDQNEQNFRLAGPLVKARIACIPAGLRQSTKLEKMFRSNEKQEIDDFVNICNKNNYRVYDFSTAWTNFSEVLQNIPFSNPNFDEFLRTKNYYEVEDDQYKYMMYIADKMLTGEKSPVELEKENIKKILLHNRRATLIAQLDDSLYKVAIREGIIKITGKDTIVPPKIEIINPTPQSTTKVAQ